MMMGEGRIHPNYQGMLQIPKPARADNAVSETQAQIMALEPGTRWSFQSAQRRFDEGNAVADADAGDVGGGAMPGE